MSRWRKAASSTSANSRSTAFRLAGLGVPDGPLRGDLAEGRPVVLADGRNIDPEDGLGPPEGWKKLVVVGDTETTDGLTCLMIRPGTFRAMMAVWQCGRKRTKCCDACKTAD
jgi:ribonuclease BN (tRNA processing enzyme)